jgi:hypothetical protein
MKHLQKFYFKDQYFVGTDMLTGATLAIGKFSRNKQLVFTAYLHQLKSLGPSLNHLIRLEGCRLITFIGTVEIDVIRMVKEF